MKPLTDQEMIAIILAVKAKVAAETAAEKFADAVEAALREQLDNGIDIDDPRIDDFLKSFTENAEKIIGSPKK